MQENKSTGTNEGTDNAKGRTSQNNQDVEQQDKNVRDISDIDQQEGQMNNGVIGGNFGSIENTGTKSE